MTENGNPVSRAELAAHLDPMREDIKEIKYDVKNLITTQAIYNSATQTRRRWWEISAAKAAVISAFAASAAVILTLLSVFLQW